MSLQEKVRYFQYMRPRYSNPSFASSNVGVSLGLTYLPANEQTRSKPVMAISNMSQVVQPQSSPVVQQKTPASPKVQAGNHRRSKSNLSSYGTSSLGNLPKFVNQRDIYQKQQKKYNIITILPKQHNETIKKYPKYHLQNADQNYYRKLKLQEQYNMRNSLMKNTQAGNGMKGQLATNPENDRDYNQMGRKNSLHDLQGNHSTVANASYNPSYNPNAEYEKAFRPKMLNNIDQLGGVL